MSASPAKPTPLQDRFILTSEEAAEFLGVSLRTIRYWVATRRIRYFHVGRFIRFKPADLTAFLESGRVDPLDNQQTIPLASAARGASVAPSDC
jgi:excisionase family DNA binding protein